MFLGYGQLTVPASTASLLIATIPAFTALWVVAFLKERLAAVEAEELRRALDELGKKLGEGA